MERGSHTPVWLITGCSAGLGLSLTRYVLAQGHRVIATSRTPSRTPDLVKEVEAKGGIWLQLDVAGPDVEQIIQEAEGIFGRLDVVVNNAAYCVLGTVEETPLQELVAQMDCNTYGPLRIMQTILPGMRKRKSGVILNVSSTQGFVSAPGNGIYAASKFAMEALSEALSKEVESEGIRVVLFELGAFKTSFGTSGKVIEPSSPYNHEDHPVAQRLAWIPKLGEIARGDPDKAAKVMFETAVAEKSDYLRVLLGSDCWRVVDAKVKELRRTVDGQQESAGSTNM
jgi:NAD(P)-dependent dehydrogenase (short-subunit alcohol dehydrogenase family)